MNSLLSQLKCIVQQIDDTCCGPCCGPCGPCCPPCPKPCGTCPCPANGFNSAYLDKPFIECCMAAPPPGPLPLYPEPVKPLQLPCPESEPVKKRCPEEDFETRYSNFYNYYNVDYRSMGSKGKKGGDCCPPEKCRGATVDGQKPCCDYTKKPKDDDFELPGCPTGFKPCKMKMFPPPTDDPCGIWCAQIQPCPPKPRKNKVSNKYIPGPCTRPCCKHWKPPEPCKYDKPCKAACTNHPPGIKPRSQS